MPVKVVVTKTDSTDTLDEYHFDRTPVIIGRASTSHLTLPDTKRVTSKEHAQLTEDGGVFYIADLGSTNSTYLNGSRLVAHQAYPVERGDTVQIGDFIIRLEELIPPAPPEPDVPEQEAEISAGTGEDSNPFREEVTNLLRAIVAIREVYDRQPSRRTDELTAMLREQFGELDDHEADGLIADVVAPLKTMVELHPTSSRRTKAPAVAEPAVPDNIERIDQVMTTLLDAVARLGGIPWRFRHEFIGQTVIQTAATAFLYESDGAELKDALLHPSIEADDFDKRLRLVRDSLEDLTLHQVALLDGYKAAVQHGATQLLDLLDPNIVVAEFTNGGVLNKLFPARLKAEIFDLLAKKAQEIRAEEWSVVEGNVYRPAFIKAYLARMTSRRR